MTVADSPKNFARLLKAIAKSRRADESPSKCDPVEVLVKSFLMWESTTAKATLAYKRITEHVVDFNDLRVAMPAEIVEFIGPRYPSAVERAQRLRAVLRDLYNREHAVAFTRLADMGKRDVKKYMRSLDGIAPYVADRVTLLSFDGHCIPVDDRLRRAIVKENVCDEATDVHELSSWLTRQVKASDALSTHLMLQDWADRAGGRSRSNRTRTRSRAASSR